jgi:peptidoglycan/LPS O-acetylase OafA/YrhL
MDQGPAAMKMPDGASPVPASGPAQGWGRRLAAVIPGRVISDADLRHDANIFNILRLVLASAVIFSHGYDLTLVRPEPAREAFGQPVSWLAVVLFFTLSGFLVTNSLVQRGVLSFAKARLLRMVPGLWVMLLVTSAITMFFFADPVALRANPETLVRYIVQNGLFIGRQFIIDTAYLGNPVDTTINGSLWTIPREVQCYVLLALLGGLGLLRGRGVLLALFVLGLIVDAIVPEAAMPFLEQLRPLAISFFAGVLLFLWRDKVFLSWPLALAVIGLACLADAGAPQELAVQLAAAYVSLVLAFLAPASWKRFSTAMPDYSYGIYIYAFPAQQAAIALGIGTTPFANMLTGFALTLPFAALSWHLIEKPALRLKARAQPASTAA